MTLFDLIALLILGVSMLVGFVRGATREVTTIVAFILAILIALFALRFTRPLFLHAVHISWASTALAILVVFIAAYIVLKVVAGALTRGIHNTRALGTLDRLVGVGFGLVRALVLLGVFYMVFTAATPADRVPHWIKGAALYPLSSASAKALMALAPQGSAMAGKVAPALEQAVKDGTQDKPVTKGKGYDDQSRQGVDRLVEQNR